MNMIKFFFFWKEHMLNTIDLKVKEKENDVHACVLIRVHIYVRVVTSSFPDSGNILSRDVKEIRG